MTKKIAQKKENPKQNVEKVTLSIQTTEVIKNNLLDLFENEININKEFKEFLQELSSGHLVFLKSSEIIPEGSHGFRIRIRKEQFDTLTCEASDYRCSKTTLFLQFLLWTLNRTRNPEPQEGGQSMPA